MEQRPSVIRKPRPGWPSAAVTLSHQPHRRQQPVLDYSGNAKQKQETPQDSANGGWGGVGWRTGDRERRRGSMKTKGLHMGLIDRRPMTPKCKMGVSHWATHPPVG
eukprot:CAMPEP_0174305424 /NCGR_PEP_ID=MMETSP0809-20121228/61405_1 /TAXON_ID=73025 ORGANISM="Eutreptiella gymnastica-like, Strain CCMP1594" /NCGR_SAMPLE_ID=MMETSP0809 /ASSEMBLY_ACC=CAM_ASM_000658 /LENGTH=105 /DNA_ID=CAMNT_0015411901 /DNA_START=924 /DNA_END=1237 /DNA_ORIENTATION=+